MTPIRWLGRWARGGGTAPDRADARWVVVDTETSGLDAAHDALIAIGAVAVDGGGIRVADSFEAILLSNGVGDHMNIEVHGIGHEAQRAGVPAADALHAYARFVDGAVCVAFHAPFDQAVLKRAFDVAGIPRPENPWLDLAELAPAIDPRRAGPGDMGLDHWLRVYGIEAAIRHNAAADALATAELLACLRARAAAQGAANFESLSRLARDRRWLTSGR